MSIKIFFVDDERLLLESLSVFFSTDEEFEVVGSAASAEEALEKLRDYANMNAERADLAHFKTLEAEYRPENSEPGRNGGIYDYTIGSVIEDHSTWSLSMLYYVDGETYYLVGYDYSVGGVGG